MKPHTLKIDTHKEDKAVITLSQDGGPDDTVTLSGRYRSEDILPEIVRLVKKHGISMSGIRAVSVHTGPGSFTGLRVGIAIARILGILYNVPVNGRTAAVDILPEYGKSKFG